MDPIPAAQDTPTDAEPMSTWLVATAEWTAGIWLGPGEPEPPAQLKPGEHMDIVLVPQKAITLHSIVTGEGWIPELLVPGGKLTAVERLAADVIRWALEQPVAVGPGQPGNEIKLRLTNRTFETRIERTAVLIGMPRVVVAQGVQVAAQAVAAQDADSAAAHPNRERHLDAIRELVTEATDRLRGAANYARTLELHTLADMLVSQAGIADIVLGMRELKKRR